MPPWPGADLVTRSIAFGNGVSVVIGPTWAVTTLPTGEEIHAHPEGSARQAATAEAMGYEDTAALTRDHDPLHAWLCDALGLPTSFSLSQAAGRPVDSDLAALEEKAVLAVQTFMRRAGGSLPF